MSYWEGFEYQLRWLELNDLNLECTGVSHLDCVRSRVGYHSQNYHKTKPRTQRLICDRILKKVAVVVHVRQTTQNLVISCFWSAEDGKKMHQKQVILQLCAYFPS